MRLFEDYLEEKVNSNIRDELNRIQEFWSKNADTFLSAAAPVYPMFDAPFDRIIKGGVLCLGFNPGVSGTQKQIMQKFALDIKSNVPPVYDRKTKTWVQSTATTSADVATARVTRGKNIEKTYFDTTEWASSKTKKKGYSEFGAFEFHAALNAMLEGVDLGEWRKKMMLANFIPLPSTDAKSLPMRSKLVKESFPWVKSFIKLSKPKLIITTMDIFGILMKKGGSTLDRPVINYITKEGLEKTAYIKSGEFEGVSVAGLHHWTSSYSGGPLAPTFKNDEKREAFKKELEFLYNR